MTTTKNAKRTTTHRITIREAGDGYRVTGDLKNYRSHGRAFDAAWRACRRLRASLYALTPDGRRILMISARLAREIG